MTVNNIYAPPQYTCDGTARTFSFPFPFFDLSDLSVQIFDPTTETITVPSQNGAGIYDFAVNGTADPSGTGEFLYASVVLNNAPPSGQVLTVFRNVTATQNSVFTDFAPLPAKALEAALDRLTIIAQQLAATTARALVLPVGDTASTTLPDQTERANGAMVFDAQGNPAVGQMPASGVISTAMQPVTEAASLAAALQLLDGVPAIASIAALRLNVQAFPAVYVENFYAGIAGGGDLFWWKTTDTTSADNGGTIIVDASGHRYYRALGARVPSVIDFGAGTTSADYVNDAAFAAASVVNSIYVPAGTFTKTTPISTPQFWGPGVIEVDGDIGNPLQNLSPTPTLPPPPQNLAPNSQAEVISSFGASQRMNVAGTALMATMAMSGYTTGSNTVVLTLAGSQLTGDMKVGDLVNVTGAGVDVGLTSAPLRVQSFVANTSITVKLPFGRVAASSTTGTITNVTPGLAASAGNGDACDGWNKTTTLWFWREDNAANVPPNISYAFGVQKNAATTENLGIEWPASHPHPGVPMVIPKGRQIVFGANVFQKIKGGSGTWYPYISTDGTGGGTFRGPSGTGQAYQWSEVTAMIPTDATSIVVGIGFAGAVGDVYYVAQPVLTYGSFIGPSNYIKPRGEKIIPIAGISLITWRGASFSFPSTLDDQNTYSFTVDVFAESGGSLAPTIHALDMQLEGINSQAVVTGNTIARLIAFRSDPAAPTVFAPVMRQTVSNVAMETSGTLVLDGSGRVLCYSGIASDPWFYVSMDTWGYLLA
jgi:hypothetical protein